MGETLRKDRRVNGVYCEYCPLDNVQCENGSLIASWQNEQLNREKEHCLPTSETVKRPLSLLERTQNGLRWFEFQTESCGISLAARASPDVLPVSSRSSKLDVLIGSLRPLLNWLSTFGRPNIFAWNSIFPRPLESSVTRWKDTFTFKELGLNYSESELEVRKTKYSLSITHHTAVA